jgi:GNAT superfamily N-acetyltransferase
MQPSERRGKRGRNSDISSPGTLTAVFHGRPEVQSHWKAEKMKNADYAIRRMTKTEITIALDWAAKEGWNPGLYDLECFYKADPKGFFIGLLHDEPIGCISAVAYGESFGFIGFYIVRPEFQKKGFGIQLWKAAMDYLQDKSIGLDGVLDRQAQYQKSGFRLAYFNIRYRGVGTGKKLTGPKTVPLSTIPLEEVQAYDDLMFPAPRHEFVQCWINQPECAAFGILDRDLFSGYGVLRICRNGFKIGPLFANDDLLAEELLNALIGHAPRDVSVFFDVPEVNPSAVALAEKNRMREVFRTARMYTQKKPDIPLKRLFGVTSFELG